VKMLIHVHFFRRAILTCKVGHTDLIFGVQSGLTSGFVHPRLQVSVCSQRYKELKMIIKEQKHSIVIIKNQASLQE